MHVIATEPGTAPGAKIFQVQLQFASDMIRRAAVCDVTRQSRDEFCSANTIVVLVSVHVTVFEQEMKVH